MAKLKQPSKSSAPQARIRVGVGGWSYAPWRGVFYPKGLKQADELGYAASKLTSIEINATHYRLQSPKSFRNWGATAPDGFVFSVKGPRLVTQQKALAETGNFVERFVASGLAELGDKLGPVLWQFAPFKRFDEDDFGKFLELLPRDLDGRKLNHVIEARHASFTRRASSSSLRDTGVAHRLYRRRGLAEHRRPHRRRRLCAAADAATTRLPPPIRPGELDAWAGRAKIWAQGEAPDDLPLLDAGARLEVKPRDVFIYFIHEGQAARSGRGHGADRAL